MPASANVPPAGWSRSGAWCRHHGGHGAAQGAGKAAPYTSERDGVATSQATVALSATLHRPQGHALGAAAGGPRAASGARTRAHGRKVASTSTSMPRPSPRRAAASRSKPTPSRATVRSSQPSRRPAQRALPLAAAGKARDRTTRAMDLFVAFWPHEETRGERRTGTVMTTPACALTHHLDRRFRQEALMSRAASASAFTAALSARRTQAATENKKMSGTRERKTVGVPF